MNKRELAARIAEMQAKLRAAGVLRGTEAMLKGDKVAALNVASEFVGGPNELAYATAATLLDALAKGDTETAAAASIYFRALRKESDGRCLPGVDRMLRMLVEQYDRLFDSIGDSTVIATMYMALGHAYMCNDDDFNDELARQMFAHLNHMSVVLRAERAPNDDIPHEWVCADHRVLAKEVGSHRALALLAFAEFPGQQFYLGRVRKPSHPWSLALTDDEWQAIRKCLKSEHKRVGEDEDGEGRYKRCFSQLGRVRAQNLPHPLKLLPNASRLRILGKLLMFFADIAKSESGMKRVYIIMKHAILDVEKGEKAADIRALKAMGEKDIRKIAAMTYADERHVKRTLK
ncbi:MAG: hypothetical protein FWD69_01895 [Polyangiaceae bacterium]|nr:hypothetical protein [Polyangiaceae bacterium]